MLLLYVLNHTNDFPCVKFLCVGRDCRNSHFRLFRKKSAQSWTNCFRLRKKTRGSDGHHCSVTTVKENAQYFQCMNSNIFFPLCSPFKIWWSWYDDLLLHLAAYFLSFYSCFVLKNSLVLICALSSLRNIYLHERKTTTSVTVILLGISFMIHVRWNLHRKIKYVSGCLFIRVWIPTSFLLFSLLVSVLITIYFVTHALFVIFCIFTFCFDVSFCVMFFFLQCFSNPKEKLEYLLSDSGVGFPFLYTCNS